MRIAPPRFQQHKSLPLCFAPQSVFASLVTHARLQATPDSMLAAILQSTLAQIHEPVDAALGHTASLARSRRCGALWRALSFAPLASVLASSVAHGEACGVDALRPAGAKCFC